MAKENKFGTFGGVFTPSVLTILGVIMYLRLPWVVGQSGLYQAIGIILVAHVISVTTGLSISSIATDKSVGAGGPYYIVSRSLGLPIGGTLGLALFVGLSFSISLYVIGFSESFLPTVGLEADTQAIRICGTLTLIGLTVITFISTSLAIKTQYFILGAIVVSLIAIFFGNPDAAMVSSEPHLTPMDGGESVAILFAIFFPAVTGFTAGVNMSGDLRDPKKGIPRGTMFSIATGLVVYIGLTVFLALRVDPKALAENPKVLQDIALNPWAVIAGIWGATLSSALGSILGAPRILQAVASDGITPKFLAKGTGKTNEPRNALFLAFAIGEAGVLIAELDAIARIVSMVFLATYGFLNASCFIESWASPDFRPQFKIPKVVSLVGAIVCLLIMIQLDLAAMAGATVIMAGLFLLLERRQLRLESGDTWEGIWASVVRAGLYRLGRSIPQQRQWRPNVLMFSVVKDEETRASLLRFATSMISGRGMLTDFVLQPVKPGSKQLDKRVLRNIDFEEQADLPVGVFSRTLPCDDLQEVIVSACRFHGFSGIEPNTILLDWRTHEDDPEKFPELLDSLSEYDLNVLVFSRAPGRETAKRKRIDVWWSMTEGNFALSLSLLRFVTTSEGWDDADLRLLLISDDIARNEDLRRAAASVVKEARMFADIRVFHDVKTPESLIAEESSEADLTILGTPGEVSASTAMARMKYVVSKLNRVLFIDASTAFEDVLRGGRRSQSEASSSLHGVMLDFKDLKLPTHPELAEAATMLDEGYQALATELQEHGIARVYGANLDLIARVAASVDRHFTMLEKGIKGANPAKRRKVVNRVQSSFLIASRELLDESVEDMLRDQASVLSARAEAFLQASSVVDPKRPPIRVQSEKSRFVADEEDSGYLRRFKRRRRFVAWIRREEPSHYVPVARLQSYYFERAVEALLHRTISTFCSDSYRMMVEVGKTINASETSLAILGAASDGKPEEFVRERRQVAADYFAELESAEQERVANLRTELLGQAHAIAQGYADDLGRLDVREFVKRERKLPKSAGAVRADLSDLPGTWRDNQVLLVERARLGLTVSTVQHRLATVAQKVKQTVELEIRNGTLADYEKLHAALIATLESVKAGEKAELAGSYEFTNRFDGKTPIDSLVSQAGGWLTDLPESYETLTDESIQRLEEGSHEASELVSVSVRRLVHHLIESRFIGALQERLAGVPDAEGRAIRVAQDVVRLVRFNLAEATVAASQDGTADDSYQQELAGALENGIERIAGELADLREIGPAIAKSIDAELTDVLQAMNVYELANADASFNRQMLRGQNRALGWVKDLGTRGRTRVREASVSLLYRRSAGLLLAKRLRSADDSTTVVDRVLDFTSANTPKPETLRELPFYYRQLFFRQSLVNESFWVGREQELARARQAISAHRRGTPGTLIIRGEHDSGKSALCRKILSGPLAKQQTFRVMPPAAGEIDPSAFRRALSAAILAANEGQEDEEGRASGGERRLLESVPDGSVIVIEDLELWWERSARGWAVIDQILRLIREASARCLFIVEINVHAFAFINRFRPLADTALAVLDCEPLPAESLKRIVMLRHASTGMKIRLKEKGEDELAAWDMARLFSRYFDYSGGMVGATLHAWVSNIDRVERDQLDIHVPKVNDWDVLDELRSEWCALLVQLALHKRADEARLQRITLVEERELEEHLGALTRSGLIVEDGRGVFEINPFVGHIVLDKLRRRGLLP
jgi:amino acid transporter